MLTDGLNEEHIEYGMLARVSTPSSLFRERERKKERERERERERGREI